MDSGGLTRVQKAGLISLMLGAGCLNSLLSKYQDMQCVANCDPATRPPGSKPVHYEQPIYQTLTMFAGETLCLAALLAFRTKRRVARSRAIKYSKLAVDDSGVVLNDPQDDTPDASAYTLREPEVEGVHVHKSVVGPDELVPGHEDPVPAKAKKLQGSRTLLMWLPALFDICGTTLMNVGLLWVPVSVYQMLRGALVLWVGLFSVIFLHRRLPVEQWAALFVVMLGVAVVGLSNSISGGSKSESSVDVSKAIIGAVLVLFAQVFTASQFVAEEKIMMRYSLEPLKAVGLEGIFGLSTTLVLMPILYFTVGHKASASGGYFDIKEGYRQTFDNSTVWLTSIAIMFSIAFFNFSGLAVTKSVSATARSLIDTCRTIGIWAVSLALGWEQLAPLQLVGFALLVYGTLCFNEVLSLPSFLGFRKKGSDDYSKSRGGTPFDEDAPIITVMRANERTPLVRQASFASR